MADDLKASNIITKSRIMKDLRQLSVGAGQVIMLHASVKAVGWVVGGPDTVLEALLDVLTERGTLMMMVSWEDNPYDLLDWPPEKRQAYLEECPAFDPATSRADRNFSILTEYLRTRPGAQRSDHPEGSFAAIGKLAKWITENHPLNYGNGAGSPLSKLCEVGGKVLMLGAPLDTITVLHYGEYLAKVPNKRIVRYQMPVLSRGKRVWIDLEEFDTSNGIVEWPGEDYFAVIAKEYLSSGRGTSGRVGLAQSYLFDAADIVKFGVHWMESKFNIT